MDIKIELNISTDQKISIEELIEHLQISVSEFGDLSLDSFDFEIIKED